MKGVEIETKTKVEEIEEEETRNVEKLEEKIPVRKTVSTLILC